MTVKNYLLLTLLSMIFFFSGCSQKIEEYNKPAMYWYGKMVKSISTGDLEQADSYYSSLQGEHISSPLLPEATMMLAIAHMHYEEYLLSEHFLSEYVRRYATVNEKEFADFLKIKSMYMALPNSRRDQVLISDAIKEGEIFIQTYPYSMYNGIVNTMLTRLYMAEAVLNETIASLYDRIDKYEAAKYYREKKPQSWIDFTNIDRAEASWYRAWFEGDGTDSWYAFLIPDTQSVVSRNTVQSETKIEKTESRKDNTIKDDTSWYDFIIPSFGEKEVIKPKIVKNIQRASDIEDKSSEQLPLD
jgi:outer membrane protein assembly factor BamD